MGRPDPSPGKDWRGEKTDRYTGIHHTNMVQNIHMSYMTFQAYGLFELFLVRTCNGMKQSHWDNNKGSYNI